MAHELSLAELDAEVGAELPQRDLMHHHRHHRRHHGIFGGTNAFASNGSGANAASQFSVVAPVQVAIGNGAHNSIGGIDVDQSIRQTNTPVNLVI